MRNEFHRVNWEEACAWAELIRAFYVRHGRDPQGAEYDYVLRAAREIPPSGTVYLQ
jgi:hypothetical protein